MSISLAEDNQKLVEAAMLGDQAALKKLMLKSQGDLKRFARRSCATAEDAEDAVQVALWQLHRKVGTLRLARAFTSWLFRIIERECRRLFRMGRDTISFEQAGLTELPMAQVPHDLRRDLIESISALPEIYREVLVLRDVEEWTAPEAAAFLGISVDAVKSRLHRARTMLRERLVNSGYCSVVTEPHDKR